VGIKLGLITQVAINVPYFEDELIQQ